MDELEAKKGGACQDTSVKRVPRENEVGWTKGNEGGNGQGPRRRRGEEKKRGDRGDGGTY